jgi:hypothetical protein
LFFLSTFYISVFTFQFQVLNWIIFKFQPELEVYVQISAGIFDAVEKCIVCGTLGTAGKASCPRCIQVGVKVVTAWQKKAVNRRPATAKKINNHTYFPSFEAKARTDAEWPNYFQVQAGEVFLHF